MSLQSVRRLLPWLMLLSVAAACAEPRYPVLFEEAFEGETLEGWELEAGGTRGTAAIATPGQASYRCLEVRVPASFATSALERKMILRREIPVPADRWISLTMDLQVLERRTRASYYIWVIQEDAAGRRVGRNYGYCLGFNDGPARAGRHLPGYWPGTVLHTPRAAAQWKTTRHLIKVRPRVRHLDVRIVFRNGGQVVHLDNMRLIDTGPADPWRQQQALQVLRRHRWDWLSAAALNYLRRQAPVPPPYAYLFIMACLTAGFVIVTLPLKMSAWEWRSDDDHAQPRFAFWADTGLSLGFIIWGLIALVNYWPQLLLDQSRFGWVQDVTRFDAWAFVIFAAISAGAFHQVGAAWSAVDYPAQAPTRRFLRAWWEFAFGAVMLGGLLGLALGLCAWLLHWPTYVFLFVGLVIVQWSVGNVLALMRALARHL